jgi:hypothetical protein
MRRHHPSNGVVFFEGPSELDQSPIVAIATGIHIPSMNRKTGFMIQTWIMNAELPPLEAVRSGKDASVCGTCSLRGKEGKNRVCYVTLADVPNQIWRTWKKGKYPHISKVGWSIIENRSIRFGSYGDPVAVPGSLWVKLAVNSMNWTGYTHEWRNDNFQYLRHVVMASVETEKDAWEAQKKGWRTYRIRLPNEPLLPFESVCPASHEAEWKSSCFICHQCDGARFRDLRRSYAIMAHGSGKGAYERMRLSSRPSVLTVIQ